MKFKPMVLALACGILGAAYMLVLHVYPMLTEAIGGMNTHGTAMRAMMVDVYPIYELGSAPKALIGILFGFADGFVGGLIFGYLYNALAAKCKK